MSTPKAKIYVQLDHTRPTAPVYRNTGTGQRVRVNVRKNDAAYLQHTFTDKNGVQKTIRLKLNSNTIDQDEQIKNNIPANAQFSDAERKAVQFKEGMLITNKPIVQKFLEESPQFEGFEGQSDVGVRPMFKLYDPEVQLAKDSEERRKRIKAAAKLDGLDFAGAKDMLLKLHGSFYTLPETELKAKDILFNDLEEANDEMVDAILSDEVSTDQEAAIVLGKLVNDGIISFDDLPNHVAKKKGDGWEPLKQISSDLSTEERQSIFIEYLTSKEGKALYDNLKELLDKTAKAAAKKTTEK